MWTDLPSQVTEALERLNSHGHQGFLVGGCVRDILRGVKPTDYDLTTSATPEEVKALFSDQNVVETGIRHGTVTVFSNHLPLEITTFRTESTYSDGRHPDGVTFASTLEEDLSRRDFTVCAMAWSPRTGLVDLYGGREDLAAEISQRYRKLLEDNFIKTGKLWEKYNGVTGEVVNAEYIAPPMMGWTAGVYLAFMNIM